MPKDKDRIVIRIPPEEWKALDDLRHARRTTFQAVGYSSFMNWLADPSKVDGGTPAPNDPRTNWEIDTGGERNKLIPTIQFRDKLAELLGSVPESTLPAVEDCILQLVESAIGLIGVKNAKRRTDPRRVERIEELEDLPGMATGVSQEPKKVG